MKIELTEKERAYVLAEAEKSLRNADDGWHELVIKLDPEDDIYVPIDVKTAYQIFKAIDLLVIKPK